MSVKKKNFPYASKLQKALEKLNDACNEISTLALQYDLHQAHVTQVIEVSKSRVADLKKQVEQKRPSTVIELTEIDSESDEPILENSKEPEKEASTTKAAEKEVSTTKPAEKEETVKSDISSSGTSQKPNPSSSSFNNPNSLGAHKKESSF